MTDNIEYLEAHDFEQHNYQYATTSDNTTNGYDICLECDCVKRWDKDEWEIMSVENGFLQEKVGQL